ncbi:hypothetical protein OAT89_00750 [bacterium]|nr:hypothetical protein [bacterium]
MKHLMTLMALVVAVTAVAQGTTIHEYPWNPDWNNDNFVGSSDLTGFLSAFGSEFGNPPEPCDYDGTPLEEWWGQAISGDIIVDSIFFELLLTDTSEVFFPGCPEPLVDTLEFGWNEMITNLQVTTDFGGTNLRCAGDDFVWFFHFEGTNGSYRVITIFSLLQNLGFSGDGFFGGSGGTYWNMSDQHPLPFPDSWFLDEDGIHIESGWGTNDWPYYANYLHILPYWHYAE